MHCTASWPCTATIHLHFRCCRTTNIMIMCVCVCVCVEMNRNKRMEINVTTNENSTVFAWNYTVVTWDKHINQAKSSRSFFLCLPCKPIHWLAANNASNQMYHKRTSEYKIQNIAIDSDRFVSAWAVANVENRLHLPVLTKIFLFFINAYWHSENRAMFEIKRRRIICELFYKLLSGAATYKLYFCEPFRSAKNYMETHYTQMCNRIGGFHFVRCFLSVNLFWKMTALRRGYTSSIRWKLIVFICKCHKIVTNSRSRFFFLARAASMDSYRSP